MAYKNSVKLLTSNFNLVWKQLLYMLLVCLITFGLSYLTAKPIIASLRADGVLGKINQIAEALYTSPKSVVTSIIDAAKSFVDCIKSNFSSIWLSLTGTFFFAVILYQFLKGLSIYNVCSLMHIKMTSYTILGYTRNLISNLWSGCRYSLLRLLLKVPFVVLKTLIILTFFELAKGPLAIFLGLFIVILLITMLCAIEISIFSAIPAKMLEDNCSAFKALFLGGVTIFKRFPRVFSSALIVVLTLVLINLLLGIFTLGVALIITVPASMVFICIFYITSYLGAKGDRYYLSKTIIVSPLLDEESKVDN